MFESILSFCFMLQILCSIVHCIYGSWEEWPAPQEERLLSYAQHPLLRKIIVGHVRWERNSRCRQYLPISVDLSKIFRGEQDDHTHATKVSPNLARVLGRVESGERRQMWCILGIGTSQFGRWGGGDLIFHCVILAFRNFGFWRVACHFFDVGSPP